MPGKVLAIDTPAALVAARGAADAGGGIHRLPGGRQRASGPEPGRHAPSAAPRAGARPRRNRRPALASASTSAVGLHAARGAGAAARPGPAGVGLLGSVVLMIVFGYGISLDVEDLRFAVLDRDQTPESRDYVAGSSPARGTSSSSRRSSTTPSWTGGCAAASSPGDRDPARLRPRREARPRRPRSAPGSTAPCRCVPRPSGATCRACTRLAADLARLDSAGSTPARWPTIEIRYRYNPDFKSLYAMVPGIIADPAALDPGHADGAQRGAREGARLDHQPLRHARRRGWNSCWASSSPTWRWRCSISSC